MHMCHMMINRRTPRCWMYAYKPVCLLSMEGIHVMCYLVAESNCMHQKP